MITCLNINCPERIGGTCIHTMTFSEELDDIIEHIRVVSYEAVEHQPELIAIAKKDLEKLVSAHIDRLSTLKAKLSKLEAKK